MKKKDQFEIYKKDIKKVLENEVKNDIEMINLLYLPISKYKEIKKIKDLDKQFIGERKSIRDIQVGDIIVLKTSIHICIDNNVEEKGFISTIHINRYFDKLEIGNLKDPKYMCYTYNEEQQDKSILQLIKERKEDDKLKTINSKDYRGDSYNFITDILEIDKNINLKNVLIDKNVTHKDLVIGDILFDDDNKSVYIFISRSKGNNRFIGISPIDGSILTYNNMILKDQFTICRYIPIGDITTIQLDVCTRNLENAITLANENGKTLEQFINDILLVAGTLDFTKSNDCNGIIKTTNNNSETEVKSKQRFRIDYLRKDGWVKGKLIGDLTELKKAYIKALKTKQYKQCKDIRVRCILTQSYEGYYEYNEDELKDLLSL